MRWGHDRLPRPPSTHAMNPFSNHRAERKPNSQTPLPGLKARDETARGNAPGKRFPSIKALKRATQFTQRLSSLSPVHDEMDRPWVSRSRFARPVPKAHSLGLSIKAIIYNSRDRPLRRYQLFASASRVKRPEAANRLPDSDGRPGLFILAGHREC